MKPGIFIAVSAIALLVSVSAFGAEPGKIIFSSVSSGQWDIWSIKPDGTDLKQLTHTVEDEHSPAVSPDQKRMVCVVNRQLIVMNIDGTGRKKLPVPRGLYAQPAWSPDEHGIVYVKLKVIPRDSGEIWMIRKTKGRWQDPVRISKHPPMRLSPSFSPDGKRLVYSQFHRDRLLGVIEEIGIYDIKTGKFTAVTNDNADNFEPAWSPSGDFIAYSSTKSGNYDIWIIDLKTGKQRRLTSSPAYDGDPSWSPEGDRIAFVSSRSGTREIWMVFADGKNLKQVTRTKTSCEGVFWAK